ncbi:MAG: S8 family serine peptidase [Bacillota bacterium]|nr:S8 family serine peptidase [Bacillota bacterium]
MSHLRRGFALLLVVVLVVGAVCLVPAAGPVRAETASPPSPAPSSAALPSPALPVFADLVGHWAERDVTLLWARGAVEAGVDGLFHPTVPITRAEFTRLLVGGMGEVSLTERLPVPFTDVDRERPEALYIAHAAELGLVKGYGDGTFHPDAPITRAEMVTILVRSLEESAGLPGSGSATATPEFRDGEAIPAWAARYVAEGVRRGLVQGYEDGTFRPHAQTSRAEAAALIVRTLHARATAFDFYGVLVRWDGDTVYVSLEGAGRGGTGRRFRLAPQVQVFRNGVRANSASVAAGDEVGLILDSRGLLCFVDAHLLADRGTLQAVRRAGGVYSLALEGQELPLPVLPGAAVFRNGQAASMADLQPGDRVYVLRQWTSGWVRALLAVRLDLQGELVSLQGGVVAVRPRGDGSSGGQSASVGSPGSSVEAGATAPPGSSVAVGATVPPGSSVEAGAAVPPGGDGLEATAEGMRLEVDPRAAIFLNGERVVLGDLRPGDEVGLARDGKGRVVYLEAWRDAGAVAGVAAAVEVPEPGRRPGPAAGEGEAVRASLELTARGQEAMRLPEFLGMFPASERPDGRGITIAIIDTGVDPAHPDLQSCPDGTPKLVDWVDFSGEGHIAITDQAAGEGSRLPTPLGVYRLGEVRSVGGVYRWGFFRERDLEEGAPHEQDLNRNGHKGDVFPVFVVDSVTVGQYDTVLVDTDRDQDLSDEIPLVPLRVTAARGEAPRVAWFGARGRGVPFVVADLDTAGAWVDLGFDGHGHGTHVAGTAAAWSPAGLKGVAPGARLMVLKALRSSGDGSWSVIARAMVYAAEHGAQVVGISAGGKADSSWEGSPESELMSQLADQYGVTFVVAAGNGGPGVGTSSPPGDGRTSLITGAYMSPAMWENEFGYQVPEESLWDFSGVGPRVDGTLAPEVVAPGSATSCVPIWLAPAGYEPMDGTSVAVPYLAGMLALMRQAARAAGYQVEPAAWREAVLEGARPLRGYTLVEQGYGLVDAVRTWKALGRAAARAPRVQEGTPATDSVVRAEGTPRTGEGAPRVAVSAYLDPGVCVLADSPGYAEVGGGVYARQLRPGRVEVTATNQGSHPLALTLSSDADWVRPTRQWLLLHPLEARAFGVEYRIPRSPGLYAAHLHGRDGGRDHFAFLSTLTVPEYLGLDEEGNPAPFSRQQSGSLPPARWQRYFFRIPAGAASLRLNLSVLRGDWGYRGRVRLHVYRPDGTRQAVSDYVGAGAPGTQAAVEVPFPQAGVWEVVVQSAPSLSYYGLDRSLYSLAVDLQAVLIRPVELRIWVPPGEVNEVRIPVEAVNDYAFFTGVLRGMGLARAGAATEQGQTVTVTASREKPAVFQLPLVPDDAVEMWLQLCDVVPSGADLDLYLYRRDPASGEWEEVACGACPGLGEERITLTFPAPGEYVAYVEVQGTGDPVNVQLCYGFLTDQGQVKVEDEPEGRELGARWSATLVLQVPEEEGFYTGRVVVYDTAAGRSLGGIPVIVQRGYPEVLAQVVPGFLLPSGGRVALHVREAADLRRAELRARVNGGVYQVTGGRVLVPVSPEGDTVPLHIRLESCSYALWEGDAVLPVAAPGYQPLGPGVGAWDRHHLILLELLSEGSEHR